MATHPDHHKAKIAYVLAAIFVIGSLIFFLRTSDLYSSPRPIEVKNSHPPTPSVTSESGWKTYSSLKEGYSFQYPSSWTAYLLPEGDSYSFGTNTVRNYRESDIEKYMEHGVIDYQKVGRSIGKVEFTSMATKPDTSNLIPIQDTLRLGSMPTAVYTVAGGSEYVRIFIVERSNENWIYVTVSVHNLSGSKATNDLKEETDQILSTFQFTQ